MTLCGLLGAVSRIPRELGAAGAAAVEIAIFVPLFMILLTGTVDLGYLLFCASRLTAAVSAGSQYAENNAAMVSSAPFTLKSAIEAIVANSNGPNWATVGADVNNGNSTNCYCPIGSPSSGWTWGNPVTCGTPCGGGGGGGGGSIAGQFVMITATRKVPPLLAPFGIAYNDSISRNAIVETQ